MPESLNSVLSTLYHPHLKQIDLSLNRMEALLKALGNPELRLQNVIHVAGTNGKGSTLSFIRAILEAAGFTCNVYTSPHLVRFNERIVIRGQEIDDAELLSVLNKIRDVTATHPATFFESTTAAAFLKFSDKPADFTLLEVGMGGRLDATNVLTKPLITAITPISFDHTEYLGDTLSKIATEKAGIIKPGVPVVVSKQPEEALSTIGEIARQKQSPLILAEEYEVPSGAQLSLPGEHQYINAKTAMAVVRNIPKLKIADSVLLTGLRAAKWPARLQRLNTERLREISQNAEVWLDGGHNPEAGEIIAKFLQNFAPEEMYIITAMVKTKDAAGFLTPLTGRYQHLYLTEIPGEEASLSAEALYKLAAETKMPNISANSELAAILREISLKAGDKPHKILFCGSLYFAGYILRKTCK